MTSLLVTADWLAAHLGDPQVRVVDVRWYLTEPGRGHSEYRAAHIPGAAYMDIDRDLAAPRGSGPGRHPLPTAEAFATVAGRAGIGSDTHVVAYDASGGAYATRLWWLLRYFGHTNVALLDGGWMEWLARGYLAESGEVALPQTVFTAKADLSHVLDANAIEALRHSPHALILDARASERYQGLGEPIDPRAGHIPGATSAPFAANLREDGSFKSAEELRAQYTALGAAAAGSVACYCGSGVTATHDIFAMVLAGLPEPALYEGSWSDWSSDPEREVATGDQVG